MFYNILFYKKHNKLNSNNKMQISNHFNFVGKKNNLLYNPIMLNLSKDDRSKFRKFDDLISNIHNYDCPCKKSKNYKPFQLLWHFLHNLSVNYNSDDKSNKILMKFVINNLRRIRCNECRNHYIKYYSNNNIDIIINDNNKCVLYFFNLHNIINKRNKKKIFNFGIFNKKYKKS